MCAIIGFHTEKNRPAQLDQLLSVWHQSRIRGLHAFGFAIRRGRELEVFKTTNFEELQEALVKAWPFNHMTGHCRYSTSGDWRDPDNNQPIVVGRDSLVFNGVVSMKTKEQNEDENGKKYLTDNDGEIVLRKYIDNSNWEAFIAHHGFSFAGIFLDPELMVAMRNPRRPLWYAQHLGATYLASTQNIFLRAEILKSKELPADKSFSVEDLRDL